MHRQVAPVVDHSRALNAFPESSSVRFIKKISIPHRSPARENGALVGIGADIDRVAGLPNHEIHRFEKQREAAVFLRINHTQIPDLGDILNRRADDMAGVTGVASL